MLAVIRRAAGEDCDAIARVHVAGWQWGYRGLLPDAFLEGLSVAERAATWRKLLGAVESSTRVWLAEREGALLGFIATAPKDETTAEIGAFYLLEDAAGTGVGRALHQAALADLRGRGFGGAFLWVLDTNARARRFYEAAGWRPDGGAKSDPRDGFVLHELRYRIDLKSSS